MPARANRSSQNTAPFLTQGDIIIKMVREWAPKGVDQVYKMIKVSCDADGCCCCWMTSVLPPHPYRHSSPLPIIAPHCPGLCACAGHPALVWLL